MRKGRLFQEICHLLERGRSTAADMAREFGVSVRTVYRDVETLNAAGIPVYAEIGRNGGVCLLKGFVLDRAQLSREERRDILESVRSRGDELEKAGAAALSMVAAMFDLPAGDWLEVDLSDGAPGEEERLRFLRRAVTQHHCAELTVAGPDGEPAKLSVMPLKLSCRAGGWSLMAYCIGQGEYRQLPLSRIIRWKPSTETFDPHGFPKQSSPAPGPEPSRVAVRFPEELADRVYKVFDGTLITQRKDGGLELRQTMPVDEDLIGRILSLGPGARVTSPASLRDEVARRAKKIYESYK